MRLPQPSGVTRAIASTCRWNMQPTSPSLTTSVLKGPHSQHRAATRRSPNPTSAELPKRRRGQRQNHASDRALPYQKPPRLHPDHRLAKEMRVRGVQAQTYHSCFRWSGQTDWTPERMGQKFVPRVIIWDVQVICCGDQGQPPQSPEKCHTTGSASLPPITKRSR